MSHHNSDVIAELKEMYLDAEGAAKSAIIRVLKMLGENIQAFIASLEEPEAEEVEENSDNNEDSANESE